MSLLLLESQAWKFHKENSLKYLQQLCTRIDTELSAYNVSNFDNYILVADREAELLQNILYLLPTDGGLVPIAFRDETEGNFCLEDDGFELIAGETIENRIEKDNGDEDNSDY